MEIPERRMLGGLLLLFGVSLLAVGLYTGQVATIVNLLTRMFP